MTIASSCAQAKEKAGRASRRLYRKEDVMGIRYVGMVAGVICVSGCQGDALDVGTSDAGAASGSSTGSAGASGGGTVVTMQPGACDAGLSTGAGFTSLRPTECRSAAGTAHAATSASDVAALLVGQWVGCGSDILGEGAVGIQLTADGRFVELTSSDDTLVAVGSSGASGASGAAGAAGSTSGASTNSPGGMFSVVDGSSSYGPGTFALHLNPDSGGLYEGEITITDSPRTFAFQAPNSNALVYAPPAPWTPRANVCSACSDSPPGGNPIDENDASALAADIVGRWVWCGGVAPIQPGSGLGMGIEFTAGGAWYSLVEAQDGTLSRSADPLGNGTFVFGANTGAAGYVGPEPLDLELITQQSQGELLQAVVTQTPKGLWLDQGFTSVGAPDGGLTPVYSFLSPLP
jgi:hypothetical protein